MTKPTTPSQHHLSRSRIFLRIAVLGLSVAVLGWIIAAPSEQPATMDDQALVSVRTDPPADTLPNQVVAVQSAAHTSGWTVDLQRQYAHLRALQGDARPLLALFNDHVPLISTDKPFLVELATQQLAQQNIRQAILLFEQALQLDPSDDSVRYQLALLWLIDDPAQAMILLAAIDASTPLASQAQQILAVLPSSDLLALGLVLTELGEWAAAERVMSQLIGIEPMEWQAYLYRGYLRDQQGGNGIDDLETALGLSDDPALVLYFLGLHWRTVDENREAAVGAFELAAELDPQNPAIAIEVALSYQELGQDESAIEWFDYTLRLDPNNIEWHRLRAAFYAEIDPETVSIQPIEQSLAIFPDDPHLLTSLGYANHQIGEYSTARTLLIEAVTLDPSSSRTQYYYGVSMEHFGDISAALAAYLAAYDSRLTDPNPYAVLAERALLRLRVLS